MIIAVMTLIRSHCYMRTQFAAVSCHGYCRVQFAETRHLLCLQILLTSENTCTL